MFSFLDLTRFKNDGLARLMNVTQAYVSKIENQEKVTPKMMQKVTESKGFRRLYGTVWADHSTLHQPVVQLQHLLQALLGLPQVMPHHQLSWRVFPR